MQPKANKKLNILLRELNDNKDITTEVGNGEPQDPKHPWLTDLHKYSSPIK